MQVLTEKTFKEYTQNYEPFKWDRHENDYRSDIYNKHSVLISHVRYFTVLQYIQSIKSYDTIRTLVDVGPYPGNMIKLVRDFINKNILYHGIGLNFSDDYCLEMSKLGGKLFETDIDPEFIEAKECKEWPIRESELVLFLDVIEHMTNPIYCLDQINKSLKVGGHLILTTDNLSAFGNCYAMFRRGVSPNIHPAQSSLFYRGDWRPHHREFTKKELEFFLQYCGFDIIKHEYFQRKQGDFYIEKNGKMFEKPRYSGIKGPIIKFLMKNAPHLRDHQILIAKKVIDNEGNLQKRPKVTYSMEEWIKTRKELNVG
jgi:SAM-dependent methyltransferase